MKLPPVFRAAYSIKFLSPLFAFIFLLPHVATGSSTERNRKQVNTETAEEIKAFEEIETIQESKVIKEKDVIEEIEIKAKQLKNNPTEMKSETKKLLKMAGTAGDPLAAIQSLPGVSFASDTKSAPAVRGSSPQDNNFYIDFIPAKYLFHFFGDSIFNENVIREFNLYPAAYGNRYSDATGAVIDVALREPRNDKLKVVLDYSLIRTGFFLEGGVTENQAFYLSYRRSLIDLYYKPDDEVDEDGIRLTKAPIADDYQLKYQWDVNPDHKLSFVATGASDKLAADLTDESSEVAQDPDFEGPAALNEQFDSQGLVWDWHRGTHGSHLKTALSHSKEKVEISFGAGYYQNIFLTQNELRMEYDFPLALPFGYSHWLTVGGSVTDSTLDYELALKHIPCTESSVGCITTDADLIIAQDKLTVVFYDLYIEDEWQLTERLTFTPGVHLNYGDYLKDTYVEPRASLRYRLNDNWTITNAAGKYHQFPNIDEVLPEFGNPNLSSPEATHYVFGIENTLSDIWDWKSEIYYKKLDKHVLALDEDRDNDFELNYSNDQSGKAYGLELLINRNLSEKWYGWASISYAKTKRTNDRTKFDLPFIYDRPLMTSVVINYQWDERWNFGIKWSAKSGALYTPIIGLEASENHEGVLLPVYGDSNSERMSSYHRMDIRIERLTPMGNNGSLSLFVDIINFYNQENIESYVYDPIDGTTSNPPKGFANNIPVTTEAGMEFFPSIGIKATF